MASALRYLGNRLLQVMAVVLAIAVITFLALNVVPGDPVRLMLGDMASEEAIEQVRHGLGLDRPLIEQLVSWMASMLHGDLGTSYTQHRPVIELMARAMGYTAQLALRAFLLALALGMTLGVVSAVLHGTAVDRLLMTVAVMGLSAPSFWMAIVLQLVFALGLKWLPLSGTVKDGWLVLPSFALGVRYAATIARVTRACMLDVMGQDYMRTALAKGLSRLGIVLHHGLRNALVPIITIVGTQLGDILAGSIVIETVFGIPGMGSLLLTAINQRDLPLIEGGVMYIAFVCALLYLVCDLLYALVDPRIRLGGECQR